MKIPFFALVFGLFGFNAHAGDFSCSPVNPANKSIIYGIIGGQEIKMVDNGKEKRYVFSSVVEALPVIFVYTEEHRDSTIELHDSQGAKTTASLYPKNAPGTQIDFNCDIK